MGRPRKPTKIKAIQGTLIPCRVTPNEMETKLLASIPKPPAHFEGRAMKEWKTVTGILWELGMLHLEDLPQLEAYCFNVGLMDRASKKINKQGALETYTNKAGFEYISKNKWIIIYNEATHRVIKLANQFGFSPASRTRISMPTKLCNDRDKKMFG
jgi:P27 family predicted phage terminase small subunit